MVEVELQIHAEGAETVTRLLVPHDAYDDDKLALWETNGLPPSFLVSLSKA
jgi:hypothetical protein